MTRDTHTVSHGHTRSRVYRVSKGRVAGWSLRLAPPRVDWLARRERQEPRRCSPRAKQPLLIAPSARARGGGGRRRGRAAENEVDHIGACVDFAAFNWKLRGNRTIIFDVIWWFALCKLTRQVNIGGSAGIKIWFSFHIALSS